VIVKTMKSAPYPIYVITKVAHTMRIARVSMGKTARRSRQFPGGASMVHQLRSPTAASIDRAVMNMITGVKDTAKSAHPACPMAKLTRSRRPAADARAARSTPFTAAELAAPKSVLRVDPLAGSGGEVVAP